MTTSTIVRDPEILGGAPVFRGTRVPVRILFECLEAGDSLNEFLDNYPGVTRKQTLEVLNLAMEWLTTHENVAFVPGSPGKDFGL